MLNCYFVGIFALFVFVAVLDAKKPIVQQNNQQQRTVAEPKKQPQKVAEAEELPQQKKQPQQQQEVGEGQSRGKATKHPFGKGKPNDAMRTAKGAQTEEPKGTDGVRTMQARMPKEARPGIGE